MNIFVRLAGVVFIALGVLLAFFTITTTPPLISQVSSVFYLISVLLAASGVVAALAKLE
ncbi:MAG: hypothetical protein M1503_11245 [Thaumarchaeota archaeon]|nr:hypothetical protein [Nitrososphaerota archaeon]